MAQQLIVEGNDAIAISNLMRKKRLNSPLGYSDPIKFKKEFIKSAKGIDNISYAINEALTRTTTDDIKNLGIIVDANQVGPQSRFSSIIKQIKSKLKLSPPEKWKLSKNGFYHQISQDLKIGVWVMPNNQDKGYLEHFISTLIPENDLTLQSAQTSVEAIMKTDHCKFSEAKKQKALLHTFLAWQKQPGLPMGTAIQANILKTQSPIANTFEDWFKNTFELEP